jgi:hypothetical protein
MAIYQLDEPEYLEVAEFLEVLVASVGQGSTRGAA